MRNSFVVHCLAYSLHGAKNTVTNILNHEKTSVLVLENLVLKTEFSIEIKSLKTCINQ